MTKTAKAPTSQLPANPNEFEGENSIGVSTNLSPELHAKVKEDADINERTLAAQVRLIVKKHYNL